MWAIAELAGEEPDPPRTRGKAKKSVATSRDTIPSKEFPKLWQNAIPDMMFLYQEICAYSCFRIHRVTGATSVDHMAPKSKHWQQIYEWSNYRLASSRLNSRKRDYSDVIDPFERIDNWFQLEFVGFQVVPNPVLPDADKQAVLDTIKRLKLNDADMRKTREDHWNYYKSGEISAAHLRRESPFVAREMERLGLL